LQIGNQREAKVMEGSKKLQGSDFRILPSCCKTDRSKAGNGSGSNLFFQIKSLAYGIHLA
jgi:hypothetical protein